LRLLGNEREDRFRKEISSFGGRALRRWVLGADDSLAVYETPVAEIGHVPGVPHFNGDLTGNYMSKRPSMIRRWLGDETIEFIQLSTRSSRKFVEQLESAFPEAIVE
jgi:hypothetical protein